MAARTESPSRPGSPNSGPRSRGSTACSRCSSLCRSSNGFSELKIMPWFGALPAKLKPTIENTDAHFGRGHQHLLGFLGDVRRVLERRPGGRLDDRDEPALILLGHERPGHPLIRQPREPERDDEERHDDPPHAHQPRQHARHSTSVPRADDRFDRAEERALAVLPLPPRSRRADSAGVRVSALNADSTTANAMVSANCGYRRPVVPGKNATGTNTDDQHERRRDDRAEHLCSSHPRRRVPRASRSPGCAARCSR